MRVNSESVSRKDANDLFKDCYNTLNQPPNLPILGDFLKLGDTPRPPDRKYPASLYQRPQNYGDTDP